MAYAVSLDALRCRDGVVVEKLEAVAVPEPPGRQHPAGDDSRPADGGLLGRGLLGGAPIDPATLRNLTWYQRPDGEVPSLIPSPPPPEPHPRPAAMPAAGIALSLGDEWVRYRSDRMEPFSRTLGGAGSALAIKFATADGDDALLAFMDEWGIPDFPDKRGWPGPKPMQTVRDMQGVVRLLLDYHREGDPRADAALTPTGSWAQLRPVLVRRRGIHKPVLTLQTQSLVGFMALEIGTMVAGGAKVMRCDHCSKIYATGDYEGRHRRIGRFCSNRCRVADQRARAKAASA